MAVRFPRRTLNNSLLASSLLQLPNMIFEYASVCMCVCVGAVSALKSAKLALAAIMSGCPLRAGSAGRDSHAHRAYTAQELSLAATQSSSLSP